MRDGARLGALIALATHWAADCGEVLNSNSVWNPSHQPPTPFTASIGRIKWCRPRLVNGVSGKNRRNIEKCRHWRLSAGESMSYRPVTKWKLNDDATGLGPCFWLFSTKDGITNSEESRRWKMAGAAGPELDSVARRQLAQWGDHTGRSAIACQPGAVPESAGRRRPCRRQAWLTR